MMERELITEENSEISKIISASVSYDADILTLKFTDGKKNKTTLLLDFVSANGLRMAIASLRDIPRLALPKNKEGEYLCHFIRVRYVKNGIVDFLKEDGESEPYGKYIDIEDGLISFNNNEDILQISFSVKRAIINNIQPKKYLTLTFPDEEVLEELKLTLDKKIFPFERFGRKNKLSYGYFHTIKEEE